MPDEARRIAANIGWAMRRLIKTAAALALLPFVLGGRAQAAETEGKVITLSCDGTLTRTYGSNEPADHSVLLQKTGAIVDLDDQTAFFLGYVVPIESIDEAKINFGARQSVDYGYIISIAGQINRASGRMDVTTMTLDPTKPNDPNIATLRYDVICTSKAASSCRSCCGGYSGDVLCKPTNYAMARRLIQRMSSLTSARVGQFEECKRLLAKLLRGSH